MVNYPEVINKYSKVLRKNIPVDSNLLLLGTFQLMYRFFDAENRKFHVLHASCAQSDSGAIVLFGDGGDESRGKTFGSLLLASQSGKYVADEYSLYEAETGIIYGNGDVPVNLKGKTAEYFKEKFNIKFEREDIIFANDYFDVIDKVKPSYIVIPYMNSLKSEIIVPYKDEVEILYKSIFYGHNAKLIDPRLDRVSILVKKNTEDVINIREAVRTYPPVREDMKIVKMMIKDPHDILEMIKEIDNG